MDYSLIPFLFVLGVSFAIGCIFSKKSKEKADYFLGNRTLSWPLLAMSLIATQVGGGFILGTADAASQNGIYALFFPLGYALGFLALGLGFAGKLRSLGLNTIPELFERYYGSSFLKKGASLLSIISLTGILIAQAVALKKFLISMGWGAEWVFLLSWLVVIFYTTQGGFLAVVWTDTVQAVVMIGMLLVAFFYTFMSAPVELSMNTFANEAQWIAVEPKILGFLLMPFLFTFIEQDMAQRCFAAKSQKDATIAGLVSAAALFLLAFIPVFFGSIAPALNLTVENGSTFMEVVRVATNPFMTACAASAVLLAIISTASSLLSAVSSNIAQDFKKDGDLSIRWMKGITFFVGALALIVSYTTTNVLSYMIASYELSVDALFVPLIAAVFYKEKCLQYREAAFWSAAVGCIGFVAAKLFPLGIIGELLPLMLSGTAYVAIAKRKVSLARQT
jgi:SSS family solute:Na+ symporter